MSATIRPFRSKADLDRQVQIEQLAQAAADCDALSAKDRDTILRIARRNEPTSSGWLFVMIDPDRFADVFEWARTHSCSPGLSTRLWVTVWKHIDRGTQEITKSRHELAEILGTSPDNISRLMSEFVEKGAIIRKRERIEGVRGLPVRYFVNPLVGTCLPGAARDRAQAEAPRLHLV